MNRWHVSILVERSLTGRSASGICLLRQCGAGRPAGESEANDKRHENDGADRHARLLVISRHDHGPWKHVSLTHLPGTHQAAVPLVSPALAARRSFAAGGAPGRAIVSGCLENR